MKKLLVALLLSLELHPSSPFCFIQKDTFTGAGGQAEFRNMEAEAADFALLKRCFGEAIQEKKNSKLAKHKHQFQRTLSLPF